MSAELFSQFLSNLTLDNSEQISNSYHELTKCLNKEFWDTESDSSHCLQVGSYGRDTAIRGVSDLDMIFELPWAIYEQYKQYENNGPSALLQRVKDVVVKRHPRTDIEADGLVVVARFQDYVVELMPAFRQQDDNYTYGYTRAGGSWKVTKPRPEMRAMEDMNKDSGGVYKDLCRMVRAWKNRNGASLSGFLIDTLAYNFMANAKRHWKTGVGNYKLVLADFLEYLADVDSAQQYFAAPGSGQRVRNVGGFHRKACRARDRCEDALNDANSAHRRWRLVFGRAFPKVEQLAKAAEEAPAFADTEEFIEDQVPVDIRWKVNIECDVLMNGVKEGELGSLRKMLRRYRLPANRKLRFHITECNVPPPYFVKWKVCNVGPEAERRNMIRGQIVDDEGNEERFEPTSFDGDHFVECYIIKNNICVARDQIAVPITA